MDFSQLAVMSVLALVLDRYFGEVKHFHPLVGLGNVAIFLERVLNIALNDKKRYHATILGVIAVIIIILPAFTVCFWISSVDHEVGVLFQILVLYFALGGESLSEHGLSVAKAMDDEGVAAARLQVGRIVSRDVETMDESDIARSTIESVLENGCDAVFGALFWFLVLGAPGAVLYRIANTLDAMWGYRTARYIYFGWAAARLDDVLNYIPARLTAVTYLLVGKSSSALQSWLRCSKPKSPNATLVMAVGAGALQVKLGGRAIYNGVAQENPVIGEGSAPTVVDIPLAVVLVSRGILLWSGLFLVIGVMGFASTWR